MNPPGDVGSRHVLQQFGRDGAEPSAGMMLFANRWRPVPSGFPVAGIVQGEPGHGAEVAAKPGGVRNRDHCGGRLPEIQPLICAVEERLVLDDRSAARRAELVADVSRFGSAVCVEEVSGPEVGAAMELVKCAVELVGPASGRDVHYRAAGTPELGVVVAGGDVHFLHDFGRRDVDGKAESRVRIVHAIHERVIGRISLPVRAEERGALRVLRLCKVHGRRSDTRDQSRQRLKAAIRQAAAP